MRKTAIAPLLLEVYRAAVTLAVLVVATRELGRNDFGLFVAALAIINFTSPLVGSGAAHLVVRSIARSEVDVLAGVAWAARRTLRGLPAWIVIDSAAITFVMPHVNPVAVLLLAAGDAGGQMLSEVRAQAFQAARRPAMAALTRCAIVTLRFVALLIMAISFHADHSTVVGMYGLVGVVTGLAMVARPLRRGLGQDVAVLDQGGRSFGIHLAAQYALDDLDKVLLPVLGTPAAAGIYAAAYRLAAAALLPIRVFAAMLYPAFFEAGRGGIRGTINFGRRLILPACSYGVIAAVGLVLAAPIASRLLGAGFRQSGVLIEALALLPFIRAFNYLLGDVLSTAGFPGLRATSVGLSVAVNGIACALLIPSRGAQGAVVASYCSEGFCVLVSALLTLRCRRKVNRS